MSKAMANLRDNLAFVRAMVRARFTHLMVFRLSFFSPFFVDGALFVIQLLVFNAVYDHVDSIGGWSRGQMIVFIGSFSLVNALNMIVYFFGVNQIPAKVKSGELDLYLTKPVSPLLRLSLESVTPGSIPLALFSFAIIAYGLAVCGIRPSAGSVALYAGLIILMTVLWYDMEVIIRCLSFFKVSPNGLNQLEGAFIDLNMKVPGVALRGGWKFVFYVILPYGIMATVPTEALTLGLSARGVAYAGAITLAFSLLTWLAWKVGLRHYESASS
jgi:ABC-2 type transport system permease protein